MTEPTQQPQEEFAETREHEYQDPHYHDEEPDIVNDEGEGFHATRAPVDKKKLNRRPPPRKHYFED